MGPRRQWKNRRGESEWSRGRVGLAEGGATHGAAAPVGEPAVEGSWAWAWRKEGAKGTWAWAWAKKDAQGRGMRGMGGGRGDSRGGRARGRVRGKAAAAGAQGVADDVLCCFTYSSIFGEIMVSA